MEENDQLDAQIAQNEKKAVEQEKKMAVDKALSDERERIRQLNTEFADDPAFANKAIAAGWTVKDAKAEYADVLKERLKIANSVVEIKEMGSEPLVSGDTDDGAGGDFLEQAEAMAKEKKISVTAAMKKLVRIKPQLHEAWLAKCEQSGKQMYAEAV